MEDQQFLNFVVCLVQHSVLYRPISPYIGLTTSKSTDTVFHYVLSITCSLELLIFQFSAHSITGSDLLSQVTGSEVTGHNYALCVCVTRAHPNAGVAIVGDSNRLPDGPLRNYPLRQVVRDTTRNNAVLDKIFTNRTPMSDW